MSCFEKEIYAAITSAQSGYPYEGITTLCVEYYSADRKEQERGCFDIIDFIIEAAEGYNLTDLKKLLSELHIEGNHTFEAAHDIISHLFSTAHSASVSDQREKNRQRFASLISNGFSYKFDEDDQARLQTLINEMREQITNFSFLEEDHKRRLLIRLEKLQTELHKKVSDLDKFWGMVGDAGVVLGKFGDDAKPFADRIKEMSGIVWKAQSTAEGLPAGTSMPLLEKKSES